MQMDGQMDMAKLVVQKLATDRSQDAPDNLQKQFGSDTSTGSQP